MMCAPVSPLIALRQVLPPSEHPGGVRSDERADDGLTTRIGVPPGGPAVGAGRGRQEENAGRPARRELIGIPQQ